MHSLRVVQFGLPDHEFRSGRTEGQFRLWLRSVHIARDVEVEVVGSDLLKGRQVGIQVLARHGLCRSRRFYLHPIAQAVLLFACLEIAAGIDKEDVALV